MRSSFPGRLGGALRRDTLQFRTWHQKFVDSRGTGAVFKALLNSIGARMMRLTYHGAEDREEEHREQLDRICSSLSGGHAKHASAG